MLIGMMVIGLEQALKIPDVFINQDLLWTKRKNNEYDICHRIR